MPKALTVTDFFSRFPTDDACLDHLMQVRFGETLACPKCGREGRFSRLRKMPAYACAWCGHHIHPMQGTPFERTRTPLQKWFYAMFLFTTTRNGVAAKELQRQLGVTYKTAWRMGHEIRKYMANVDGDFTLGGHVEIDEAYIGGKQKGIGSGNYRAGLTTVVGMVERGGDVVTEIVEQGANDGFFVFPILERVRRGLQAVLEHVDWQGAAILVLQRGEHFEHTVGRLFVLLLQVRLEDVVIGLSRLGEVAKREFVHGRFLP